jgi:hypothetical protein
VSSCGVTTVCPASVAGGLTSAITAADAVVYVIYPIIGATPAQTDTIVTLLKRFLPDDPAVIFTAIDVDIGIFSGKLR